MRKPGLDAGWTLIPETVGEATTTTSNWWVLIPAIAVAIAIAAALIVRNQQARAQKERAMATTIETPPSEQLRTAERNNRWLVVAVVVLAVALVALGAWVLYDQASEPDTTATEEVTAALDEYTVAWNSEDADAFRAATTEAYIFVGNGKVTDRESQAQAISIASTFEVRKVGDLVVMGEGPSFFVTVPNEISYGGNDYVGISTYRIVETPDGLKVTAHNWVGNI